MFNRNEYENGDLISSAVICERALAISIILIGAVSEPHYLWSSSKCQEYMHKVLASKIHYLEKT